MKTASRMLETAEALSAWIKPSSEGDELRRFVNEGRQLAEWLHVSGHTARWGSPDSILPGEWLWRTERLARDLD